MQADEYKDSLRRYQPYPTDGILQLHRKHQQDNLLSTTNNILTILIAIIEMQCNNWQHK